MIKATIQNSPYCTEIRFPCSETELSKKLGEIGMNTENLAPMATVIEIEPVELSVLEECDVSLDALNYLGKRMDGMCKAERNQFLAVLSCDELEIGYGLKNIINLTYKSCAVHTHRGYGRSGANRTNSYAQCPWLSFRSRIQQQRMACPRRNEAPGIGQRD